MHGQLVSDSPSLALIVKQHSILELQPLHHHLKKKRKKKEKRVGLQFAALESGIMGIVTTALA